MPIDLKKRTRDYALRVIRLVGTLPKRMETQVIGRQLMRSGTSVGANYREAMRARSHSEYAAKMSVALMEIEESLYWLELLDEGKLSTSPEVRALQSESNELAAIFVTIIKKVRLSI